VWDAVAVRAGRVVPLAIVAAISAVEAAILERLLFRPAGSLDFVVESVRGILNGTPVYKAWQQRLLGPLVVAGLDLVTGETARSLLLVRAGTLVVANLLLYRVVRARGGGAASACAAVAAFAIARVISVYRLEYPWDGIDAILFVIAGDWAARDRRLASLGPVLLVGLLNHETVLYLPLWALLAPLEPRARRETATALATAVVLGAIIVAVRHLAYRGQPVLPGQVFEPTTPFLSNPLHVAHNARALFEWNWRPGGRPAVSIALFASTALLGWSAARPATRRLALWSFGVLATIVCFGFVNETRLYLPLIAFAIAYAWPPRAARAQFTSSG
jgi:hypothetical protein